MTKPTKVGLRTITRHKIKQALVEHPTAEALAEHLSCNVEAARRMISLIPSHEMPLTQKQLATVKDWPQETIPYAAPSTPLTSDPFEEPLEWSYRKFQNEMELGSESLLIRMLKTGQHWLPPQEAAEKMQEYGVSQPEML